MKWSSRFIGFLVVTACLVVTFVFVSKETFSWFQTLEHPVDDPLIEEREQEEEEPDEDGIDLTTVSENEKGGSLREKKKMFEFPFGLGGGDAPGGLGTLFAILAAAGLIVYSVRKWLRRRRLKGLTFLFTDDTSTQPSHEADATIAAQTFPMLTNIELRDWLITFNASLAPELKLRTNETVVDWFERIELTDIDASLYHLIRYGPASDHDIPFEQQQRFHEALDRYLKRQP
ncbi:MAG: hypothetical protein ACK411_00335 [Exiguobacterium mexicanum]